MMSGVEFLEKLKSRWPLVLVAVLVLAVAGVATWVALGGDDDEVTQPLPPTVTPSMPNPEPADSPPASPSLFPSPSPATGEQTEEQTEEQAATAAPALAECGAVGEEFVPVRYTMENPAVDASVVSLGLDADGAIAAPPKDQPTTASWWNQGPRAGAAAGKTVLSIHTYRSGGAQGNAMYEGGRVRLEPGDLIKLYGADGEVACYEFVEATKVWVDDYDPDSDIMVDFAGDPLLTIIICWDHVSGTDDWASRIFFYAQPVTA